MHEIRHGEVIVIGAGIAGASVACELAATRRVLLLEREGQPAITPPAARPLCSPRPTATR